MGISVDQCINSSHVLRKILRNLRTSLNEKRQNNWINPETLIIPRTELAILAIKYLRNEYLLDGWELHYKHIYKVDSEGLLLLKLKPKM